MDGDKPRLRTDLMPVRASIDGRDVILLRDPLALSSQVIALGGGAAALLGLLDGTRGIPEIRLLAIQMQGGNLGAGDDVESLLRILDERCLLVNDRYEEARENVLGEWNALIDRPSAFAGAAYPADGAELSRFLDEILENAPEPRARIPDGRLVGLVAPHVDLARGWPLYGAAYRLLRRAARSIDRIIVLGTGHSMTGALLGPTSKHYMTPLGRCQTDLDLVQSLLRAGADADDFPHRSEHSVEFQAVFLQHIYAEDLPPLVPILCGDAARHLDGADRPASLPGAGPVLDIIRDAVTGGRCLAVAGVDLSHVGPKFGDDSPSSALLPEALAHEAALIEAMERVDPLAFWAEARRVRDGFHVCGLSALGFLLEALPPGSRGVLLGRDVMREPDTSSAVGFAAMAFFA